MTRQEYEEQLAQRKATKTNGKSEREQYELGLKSKHASEVGQSIVSRTNSLLEGSKDLYNKYNERYKDGNDTYRSDATDYYESTARNKAKYTKEYDEIKNLLTEYSEVFDKKWVDEINSVLDQDRKNISDITDYAYNDYKYWSQFADEDEYNKVAEAAKNRDEMLSFDIEAGLKELDSLKEYKNKANKANNDIRANSVSNYGRQTSYEKKKNEKKMQEVLEGSGYTSLEDLNDDISKKEQYYNQAKLLQEKKSLTDDAQNAADFNEYSAKGKELAQNNIAITRNAAENALSNPGKSADVDYLFDKHAEENEKDIYSYYLAKENEGLVEKGTAQRYLESLRDTLNQREAGELYDTYKGVPALFAVASGLDQFGSGIRNVFNFSDDYIAPSAVQYASSRMRNDYTENNDKVGGAVYDSIVSISNMAPSIFISIVTGNIAGGLGAGVQAAQTAGRIAGAVAMGTSAAGNYYQDALNSGFTKKQARTYSVLAGGSEIGLEYALGGIASIGGAISGKTVESITKGINNGLAKAALDFGLDAFSEGNEEFLQDVLDPYFKSLATGQKPENIDWEQAAYSGILGAITAGVINGVETGGTRISELRQAKNVIKNKQAEIVKNAGLTYDAETLAYKLAQKVDENTGAYQLSWLIHEMNGSLSEQTQNDITRLLVSEGMTQADAEDISEALAYAAIGGNLSELEKKVIDKNPAIAVAAEKIIIDRNLTVNQHINALETARNSNAFAKYEKTVKNLAEEMQKAQNEQEAVEEKAQLAGESRINSNAEDIKKVIDSKNGIMTVELVNGQKAKLSDVEFKTEDDATLYKYMAEKQYDAKTANAVVSAYKASNDLNIRSYLLGMDEGIEYGYAGVPVNNIREEAFTNLPATMQKLAYDLGRDIAKNEDETSEKNAEVLPKTKKKKGKVEFDGDINKLTDRQKVSLDVVQNVVNNITNNNVVFFESKEENGKRVLSQDIAGYKAGENAPNGFYDPKTGTIYLDINAGKNGEGTILYTFAHELTHFVRQWSAGKFRELGDFLAEEYGKTGEDMIRLAKLQMAKAARNGRRLSFPDAYEEVVADSMQTMFTDADLLTKLDHLKQKDIRLWDKIKNKLAVLIGRIKTWYAGLEPDSTEAKTVSTMENLQRLADIFAEGIVEAGENYSSSVDTDNISNGVKYSLRAGAEDDVTKALNDNNYTEDVYLTETSPSILTSQKGVRNLPLLMKASHIRENVFTEAEAKAKGLKVSDEINYHGLGKELFLKIIDGLENVKLAYRGTKNAQDVGRREDYFLLISQYKDKSGNIINVPVYINRKGQYNRVFIDTNKVATVFGKKDFWNYIQKELKNGNLIKIKNKSTRVGELTSPINASYDLNASNKHNTTLSEKSQEENFNKHSDRDQADAVTVTKALSERYDVPYSAHIRTLVADAYKQIALFEDNKTGFKTVDESVMKIVKALKEERQSGKKEISADAKEVLDYLKGEKISLTSKQKQEVIKAYDSYGNFTRALAGRVGISDNAKTSLDQVWGELSERFPQYFAAEENEGNMPIALAKAVDILKNTTTAESAENDAVFADEDDVFNDVYQIINDIMLRTPIDIQSARSILSSALMSVTTSVSEQNALAQYQKQIKSINAQQNELAEVRKQIKELSFGKGKRDTVKIAELQNRASELVESLNKADKVLMNLEVTAPIKEILNREKLKMRKQFAKGTQEVLEQYKITAENKIKEIQRNARLKEKERISAFNEKQTVNYYRPRIVKAVYDLSNRLLKPTAKTAIPDEFASSVATFLSTIHLTSYDKYGNVENTDRNIDAVALQNALLNLSDQLKANAFGIDADNNINGSLDISPELAAWVNKMSHDIEDSLKDRGEFNIYQMNGEQLETLYKLIRGMTAALNKATEFYRGNVRNVKDDCYSTIDYLEPIKGKCENKFVKPIFDVLRWDFATPVTAFDRFGDGGKHRIQELCDGQGRMAQNMQVLDDFIEGLYTKEEVNAWQNDNVKVMIHGEEVTTTIAQLMSLYCLIHQQDSARHIYYGGGIRFADVTIQGNNKITDQTVRYQNTHFSEADYQNVLTVLREKGGRAIEVAKAMQRFMADTGAKWGNEISQVRFGYDQMGVEDYFPIRTVAAGAKFEAVMQRNNIFALLNKSFTKERDINARNAVIVDSIFEVFSQHMSDMALYNAWALPVLDVIKWFNFKEASFDFEGKNEITLKDYIRMAYGDVANSYISRFLTDINSSADSGLSEGLAFTSLRLFNRVAIAANIRVAVQQPFSITRAFELINPKYCEVLVGKARKAAYNEMLKNSSFGLWKSMGYFDVDVARPFETQVLKNESIANEVIEKSMFMAEDGDNFTWALIYNACKNEAKQNNPTLSDTEILQKTKERFDDIILRTQVVDSVLTKSQWMRSNKFWHRMTSSFMSEPLTSYNMLLRRYDAYHYDAKQTNRLSAFGKNIKPIGKTMGIFLITQLVNALVTAPIDAARDDDDYKTYFEKLLKNFKENALDNINPANMLPVLKDISEYITYGNSSRTDLQIYTKIIDFAKQVYNTVGNYDYRKLHQLFKSTLEATSVASGLPISNAMRDVIALWNTSCDAFGYNSLKFETSKTQNKEGYTALLKAVKSNDENRATDLVLQMYGNCLKDTEIMSGVQNVVKAEYLSGKMSKDQVTELLQKTAEYVGLSKSDAEMYWLIDKWDYQQETGSSEGYQKYDDFEAAIRSGKDLKTTVKTYLDNGVSEKTLASQITSMFKTEYVNASRSEKADLKPKILNAYVLLGYDRDKKNKEIDKWE